MSAEQDTKQARTPQEKAAAKQERFRQRVRDEIRLERRARFPWAGFAVAAAVGVVVAGLAVRSSLEHRIDTLDRMVGDVDVTSCDLGAGTCTDIPASGLAAEVEELRDRVTELEYDAFVAEQAEALETALAKAGEAGLTQVDCTAGTQGSGTWAGPWLVVDRGGQWWFEDTRRGAVRDFAVVSAVRDQGTGWLPEVPEESGTRWRTLEPCVRAVEEAVAVLAQVQGGETQ